MQGFDRKLLMHFASWRPAASMAWFREHSASAWRKHSAFTWRRPATAPAAEVSLSPWVPALATVAGELRQLNQATETDFLAIGGMLTGFITTAHQISSSISAMSESISGSAGQDACQSLEAILQHAQKMEENAGATNKRLLEVRRFASRIGEEFSGFQQTVSSFQLVATLARIETERLGASDSELGNLTEEFRSHAANVVEGVDRVLADVSAVEKRIASTVAGISALQQQKLKRLPKSILGIKANLAAFRERQGKAVTTTATLSSQVNELSLAIGEIVNSIQFHDITRQQIEHVEEALTELYKQEPRQPAIPLPSRQEALVISLQRAQVEGVAQLFSRSVAEMDHQLQTIAAQVQQMTAAQQTLLELHGGQGESFFLEMQRSFESIIEAIGDCEAMESSVRTSILELQAVVDRLNKSSQNIRSVTIQLKWLALNACVSAIKIGPKGEALNVVAQSMQSLQTACEVSCLETEATIASIHAVLAASTGEPLRDERSGPAIRALVSAQTLELQASSQASTVSWKNVRDTAEAFSANIQLARERLAIGMQVTQTLEHCNQLLGDWVRDAEPITEQEEVLFREDFQKLSRRYTMKEEREIQQRFLNGNKPGVPQEPVLCEVWASEPNEFGDNIELF